ncbi:MAG: fibronectin type III domain-containing protein, partial [Lachnospiraceae bacterium]|nr:fibronectin type III domain-containing protein [Lachnospiraceae bacterium]
SGVGKIEYYIANAALSQAQAEAVTDWKTYDSAFNLNPENKYVVYARITDKAGNITYLSSDGLVFVNLPVGYVTDIGVDSAKLNMKLSDSVRTEIKAAGFEYKKKADADTVWTKVAADSVTETITKEIASLTAGTNYVFRPYVTYTNDSTDTGAEQNFTTDTKPAVTGSIDVKVKNETDDNKDVVVTIEEGNNVLASQEYNGIAKGAEVTTGKFKELPDGTYNIVIKSKDGEFVETKMITIANGASETISFTISKGEMKTDVEVEADTPKVAVDGLSKEELVQSGTITSEEKTKVESGEISLEVTLKAEKKETSRVETKTVSAIQQVMAESSTKLVVDMFLDLSLFKTVTQLTGDQAGKTDKTDIGSTNTKVLEIAVPYDTTIKGLMVYRYHGSSASVLKKLSSAPAKGAAYEDGSFYLSDKYIHIFASGFSTYAIAKEEESSSGGGGGTTPVTPGKTTPAKPSAPTLDSKTETSITVKAVAGQEYSIDGGKTWQTSGTFTGLTPETEYSIVTKITATSTANESPVSDALTVTTDKKADPSTPTPTDKPTETPGSTTKPTETPTTPTETPATPTETPASQKDKVTKTEKAAAKISINAGLKVSQSGKKVTVKWGKVSKADRYVVYAAYCGPDKCTKIKALSGGKTSMTFTKLNGSKLNLKKNVKVYVVAYRKVNGKETKLARSITAHIVGTKNTKYTNVKKIKLSKSKYTLKVNKTATIKAKIVLVDKKKKQLSDSHAPEFRYASSNTKVATVDKNGKITAVKKGTCYIYVYAKNGYAKKVKVTVK